MGYTEETPQITMMTLYQLKFDFWLLTLFVVIFETVVLWRLFNTKNFFSTFSIMAISNVLSAIIGAIGFFLFALSIQNFEYSITSSAEFVAFTVLIAYIASIIFEFPFFKFLLKSESKKSIFLTDIKINTVSYIMIGFYLTGYFIIFE